jgi:hypothetical protein
MHTPAERACRMTVRGKRHVRLLTNLVSLRIPEEHVAAQVRDMRLSPAGDACCWRVTRCPLTQSSVPCAPAVHIYTIYIYLYIYIYMYIYRHRYMIYFCLNLCIYKYLLCFCFTPALPLSIF